MKKLRARVSALELILLALALVYVYPIFLMFANALKSYEDYVSNPFGLPKAYYFDNFAEAYERIHFGEAAVNSALITAIVVACLVLFSSMTAYAVTKRASRMTAVFYILIVSGILIPYQVYMIPQIKVFQMVGILRTPLCLALAFIAQYTPLSVFLYTGYLKTVPKALEEAALIDGCSAYGVFFKIIFPIIKPCTSMVVIFFSVSVWNAYTQPLVLVGNNRFKTLFLQIQNLVGSQFFQQWNMTFAACSLALLPLLVLYIIMQNRIISGMTSGAVKG